MKIYIPRFLLLLIVFCFSSANSLAGDKPATVTGQWKTIDDKTGKPKSIIEIYEKSGVIEGKIITLINPSKPNPTCDKCKDHRANKPIKGMVILWGVSSTGQGEWSGGKILDPKKGKTYKVKLTLQENTDRLDVRGYIAVPMLGRTQIWQRVRN